MTKTTSPPHVTADRADLAVPLPSNADRHPVVEALTKAVQDDLERLSDTIVDRTIGPLAQVIERANAAHEELLQRLRAEAGEPVEWERVVRYRRDVTDQVVEPIETHVTATSGESIGQACLDLLAAWGSKSGEFPETLQEAAPDSLFAPESGDRVGHRIGKAVMRRRRAMARVGRRLRRLLRSGETRDDEVTRTIPLRVLVDFHAGVRLGAVVSAFHEQSQQRTAQCLAALVEALAKWTDNVLALEHDGDHAALHQPAILAARWSPLTTEEESGEEGQSQEDPRERLLTAAQSLQDALASACALGAVTIAADPDLLAETSTALSRDLERAGTFLVRARDRRPRVGRSAPTVRLRRRSQMWADWHTRAHNRLTLAHELLDLRRDLIQLNESLLTDTCDKTLVPVFETFDAVRAELQRAREEATASLADLDDPAQLARGLRAFQKRTLRSLERVIGETQAIVASTEALAEPGRQEWELLDMRIEHLPGDLVVHEIDEPSSGQIDPDEPAFGINLRRIARQAFEPPWPVLLRPPAAVLRKADAKAWGGTEQVLNIVQYNLGAALDELEAAGESKPDGGSIGTATPVDAGERIDSAKQLALDALRRSVDVLDDLEAELQPPWQAFAETSVDALKDDWSALLRRVRSEDSRQEKWVGFQTGVARGAERLKLKAREWWSAAVRSVGRGGRLTYRWADRLARRGRAAVGVTETAPEDRVGAIEAMTAVEQRVAEFPLVYRRLFSLVPLTESTLFEARARDLVRLRRHFEGWKEQHRSGVVVVSGPLGSGRTTLLNVVEQAVFQDCETHRISWDERIDTDGEVAGTLGEAMRVPAGDPPHLDALEQHLRQRRRGPRPIVCLIDNLEHLFLQVPGGCDLIERFLIFLARTDSEVYWIATIGREAWQYLEKTAATTVGFVTSMPMTLLDRTRIEEVMLSRHRRSGMELQFLPAEKVTTLMRQRLRRARTLEAKQAILREAFFDSMFKAADQQIALGLFYWLKASHVDEEEDAIQVRPLEILDFAFLAHLDLTRLFTLKAFVVHRTLSLDELGQLLRLPPDQGILILESLLSLQLIEPVPAPVSEGRTDPPDVTTQRFRLRRLVVRPVLAHLMSKRMVY